MPISVTGENAPTLTAWHVNEGVLLSLGSSRQILLSKEAANKLGRYILFKDDSDPSTEDGSEVVA